MRGFNQVETATQIIEEPRSEVMKSLLARAEQNGFLTFDDLLELAADEMEDAAALEVML